MKRISKILQFILTYMLLFLGIIALIQYVIGPGDHVLTYLWLIPAQIILQPAYKECAQITSNLLGNDKKN